MPIKNKEERSAYNREYRNKNIDKIKEKNKKWVDENKDKVKEYQKAYGAIWYKKNIEKRREQIAKYQRDHRGDQVKRVQKYVSKNKDKVYEYGKIYNRTISGKYRAYRNSAKKRNKSFLIDIETFEHIFNGSCRYCNEENACGIDRVDNSVGYEEKNCVPCCKTCNYMKKTFSTDIFLAHVKKIYIFNNSSTHL